MGDTLHATGVAFLCMAGVMLVVIVLGMSNPLVIVAGAAVMLAYKLIPWPAPALSPGR